MGICFGCVLPMREGSVRDLRNGDVTTASPGDGGSHPDLHLRRRRRLRHRPLTIPPDPITAEGDHHDRHAEEAPQPDRAPHPEDIEALGVELDAIRAEVIDARGERDAAYIRKVITFQRKLELGSRAVLLFSIFPPAWIVGTAGLSVAKILENMEIGHNVMHGQWDWMRDPKIHSTTWEWDNASPSEQWKHSHNELHHTFTNVLGNDNDLGYGIMRVDEDQRWHPVYLGQPLWNFINACFFEYGIAAYDLELGRTWRKKRRRTRSFKAARPSRCWRKIRGQITKDYVLHPLLSGPSSCTRSPPTSPPTWCATCGPTRSSCAGTSPRASRPSSRRSIEGETRGEWYLRQMLGSANISGGRPCTS